MATLDKIRLSGTTYDLIDSTAVHSLDGYYTSEETNNAITAATNALAESIAEQGYQTSGDVQNAISGKADTTAVTADIAAATSGKVDNDTYTAYTAATEAVLSGKADASDLTSLFGNVEYDSSTKRINFYHDSTTGTVLAYVDATDFIKDGMVDNVEIKDVTLSGQSVTCLVITFNTDSGKEEIDIPISQIFDATNYYTKAEVDTIVSGINDDISSVSGDVATKQDALTAGDGIDITNNTISVTGAPLTMDDNVTSGSSNPVKSSGIYNFVTGETATKQDTLVSGTNIKTINNTTLLGSGDITILQPNVSGTTLIFS